MQLINNLKMTLENNEQATKAVEIIKGIAAKRIPEYPEELTEYIADLVARGNTVMVEESYSLLGDTFLELTSDIIKACVVLTQSSFEVDAWQYSCNCGYSSSVTAARNGNELKITTIVSENGNATCPECGVTIVSFDEYDPNETYYCPECGEEMDHLEMFEGCLPEISKEVVEISKLSDMR